MTLKSVALPKLDIIKTPAILQNVITNLESLPKNLYLSVIGKFRSKRTADSESYSSLKTERKTPFKKSNYKRLLRGFAIFVVAIVVLFGATSLIKRLYSSNAQPVVQGARATQEINREFSFPLKDEGEKVADIKYVLQKAEITDEIIVKGQRAKAVKGRSFLIITLKIINDYKEPITMQTRDYVSLSVNGNEDEWLAPDIHNDPVEIRAISTKYTRLGFAIDNNATNLLLRVGEIDGEKELVPLELN